MYVYIVYECNLVYCNEYLIATHKRHKDSNDSVHMCKNTFKVKRSVVLSAHVCPNYSPNSRYFACVNLFLFWNCLKRNMNKNCFNCRVWPR